MFTKLFVALACGAVFSFDAAAIPADCDRTFVVAAGDTCNSISQSQSVSTFQLAFVNPNINAQCTNLTPGEELCLGRTGQDCTVVHTVMEGEFCALIASNAGIPLSTLLTNNPNVNSGCTNLGVGEVLCTTSEIIDYTQPSTKRHA